MILIISLIRICKQRMYKCAQCGHEQEQAGNCEQCGAVGVGQEASNEAETMPEGFTEEPTDSNGSAGENM